MLWSVVFPGALCERELSAVRGRGSVPTGSFITRRRAHSAWVISLVHGKAVAISGPHATRIWVNTEGQVVRAQRLEHECDSSSDDL